METKENKESIIEYLIENPERANRENLRKVGYDGIIKIIKEIPNDHKKTEIIFKSMAVMPLHNKMEKEVYKKQMARHITKLDDKEQEIERLVSSENLQEVKIFCEKTSKEALIEWIRRDPRGAIVLRNFDDLDKCMSNAKNDYDRAIILMSVPCSMEEKLPYYNKIKDDFYKMKITEGIGCYEENDEYRIMDFVTKQSAKFKKYKTICDNLGKCKTEEEKVKYIAEQDDNDMKIALLNEIKESQNREVVIGSITKQTEVDTFGVDRKVRKMIWEFIDDYYKGEIPQDKKERLKIALQRTSCNYGDIEKAHVKGRTYLFENKIELNKELKDLPEENAIMVLLHEYAHILSNYDIKRTAVDNNHNIEEGNADIFSEMITNYHYKKMGMNDKYIETRSAYHKENSYARTLLYPLEQKGKDIDALMEYMLGSKEKYYEQVFSLEKTQELPRNGCGQVYVEELDINEIYMQHKGEYNKNPNSIYMRRNQFISNLIKKDNSLSITKIARSAMDTFISIKDWTKNILGKTNITRGEIQAAEQAMLMEQSKTKEGEKINEK